MATRNSRITNATRGVAFRQGLISNILNPKAYLFYAAMLPQFVSGEFSLGAEVALLSAVYVAVATVRSRERRCPMS